MEARRFVLAAAVAVTVAFGAAPAWAQHEGEHAAPPGAAAGQLTEHHGEHLAGPGLTEGHEGLHATEHGTAHGAHGAHEPEPINWTQFGGTRTVHGEVKPVPPPFIATLINFVVLAAILFWAVTRKINPALADRRAVIEAEIGEAQRLRAEAEAMHREYTERLAKMESEFAALREEFVKAGEAEYARIIAEANARAERMQREGELTIQQEIRQLRSDLLREAVEAATASAEHAVRTNINSGDQGRLAEDYLANLEKDAVKGAQA
jgi:F-type H+-transporting ATPase subunit b